MKNNIFIFTLLFIFSSILFAQKNIVKEDEFKVFGNCGQCKTRIEKALKIKEVKKVKWNKKTKMLKVAYLFPAIKIDSLQQRIAAVGHDTEKFNAPDSVYKKLPACCLYRDNPKTH